MRPKLSPLSEEHDICSLAEGGYRLAGFEVELVGALSGDEGDHVIIPRRDGLPLPPLPPLSPR